jgi:LacI family transcriptional regulator
MAMAYYEHRMHRGVAAYASEASWILDTTMAHYGTPPAFWRGDGVLALTLPDRPDLTRYLRTLDLPIVAMTGDAVKGLALTRVVLDNLEIGRIAAEHLLERGFRNLAYYKCTDYQDVRERETGFAEVLKKNDLRYKRLNWFNAARRDKQTNPHAWLKKRLLTLPKPVGILAQSDHRAYFLLNVAEEAGIRVPEEVAVVGVDNDECTCQFAPVPITSVDSNRHEYAYQAARTLDLLMKGRSPKAETKRITPRGLVIRRSSDILALEDPDIAQALGFIWKHFHQRIGVEDVVAATAMSRCRLYDQFKQFVGRTIREEIERKRLERAQQLLLTTTDKIAHIARSCGFASGEQFCRAFARRIGDTPSCFRRKHSGDAGQTRN